MKFIYFIIFYVLIGTAGISLPCLINNHIAPTEVSIGLITIVMSSVGYSASEKMLQLYDEKTNKKTVFFSNLVALAIAFVLTVYVCIRISDNATLLVSICAYISSCLFWWHQNKNNKNFENTSASTLGGTPEQFNK